MARNYTVGIASMEASIPEFNELLWQANSKGGMGLFIGDTAGGLNRFGVRGKLYMPWHKYNWLTCKEVVYDAPAKKVLDLSIPMNGTVVPVSIGEVNRGGTPAFGIMSHVFDWLYTENKEQRFQQEMIFGKTLPLLLKAQNFKPDILLVNESHTAPCLPVIKDDPFFKGTKIVAILHTPDPGAMEKNPADWFDRMETDRKYYLNFVRNGCLDFTWALVELADTVIAVSQELGETLRGLFPEHAAKIAGIRDGSDREFWRSSRLKAAGDNLSSSTLWSIFQEDEKDFFDLIAAETRVRFSQNKPTVGLLRRFVPYKNQIIIDSVIRAICAERGEWIDTCFGRLEGLGMQVFYAGLLSDNNCQPWFEQFRKWMEDDRLKGKFVFLEKYFLELLKKAAAGCAIWLSCPWKKCEGCGTSDGRAEICGNINLATCTGGAKEYIQQSYNGFFIEPYGPLGLYEALKTLSKLYYAWREKGDPTWLKLKMNAFVTGKSLDITEMLREYEEKVFKPLLGSS